MTYFCCYTHAEISRASATTFSEKMRDVHAMVRIIAGRARILLPEAELYEASRLRPLICFIYTAFCSSVPCRDWRNRQTDGRSGDSSVCT